MKRLLTLFLCAICAMSAWAEITPSQPAAGTGTPSDPYQITNREELYWFVAETNNDKTVCAKLIADIVVNEGTFDSDGKWSKPGTPESWKPMAVYGGIFDGNGHVISGLYNNDGDAVLNVGFCSGLSNGTIKNLGIINTYFNAGKFYSGIIAPNVTSGIITNCYTAASTIIGTQYAGGIIAANIGCTISNCYSTSTGNSSKGQNYYGGISGINRSGEIVNCYTNQPINRGGGVHKDDSDFKSGEVTYLLNEGKNDGTQMWFQDLSEGGDDYPTFVNTGSNAVQLSSDGKSYVNNIAHTHTLTKVDAVAATSTEHGHNEYWACSGCGNWFADETGTTLTTIEELVTHYIEYVNGMGTCQVCNSFRYEVPPTDMQGTYLIGNTGQLIAFANMVNNGQDFRAANAKLISDIILNEGSFGTDGTFIATGSSEPSTPFSWPIIGAGTHTGNGYKGTFDGQGHTVSGLYVYDNPTGLASFVGILEANGKIMNLGVINSYFEGSRVGGISGYTDGKSEIINCYSDIIGKGDYIGGIVGQGSECKGISNCYSTSELTCTVDFLSAGGIVGEKNSTFPITNCYTTCSTILGLTFNSFESACEAGVSVERFASGEIAYKLNGSTSEGNFVWYQKIGEGGDAYPSLTKAKDNTVYYAPGYLCDGVTADGEMHYSNNGGRYVADHTEATDAAVAATCTETGLTEGKHCSICYTVLVEQVETEPLGHSWGEYHLDGDQTCTYDGHKTAECTREGCSEKNKIVATGAALGHLFTEYLSNGDATTEADGHKTAECDRGCGATDTVIDEGSRIVETPTYPVDPTDPVDPEEPTDPADPVDPVDPVDPEDPEEPTDPVDPEDPTDPADPIDPVDPVDPEYPDYCELISTPDNPIIQTKFENVVYVNNKDLDYVGYQWMNNGNEIAGATEQFYVDPKGRLSGIYMVRLTFKDGSKKTACKIIEGEPALVKSAVYKVLVYPNPAMASEEIKISIKNFDEAVFRNARIMIFGNTGLLVKSLNTVEPDNYVSLPTGSYTGTVIFATGKMSFKIIVK